MAPGGYRVPTARAEAELKEKGSRFLAVVAPAGNEAASAAFVEELTAEHADATHCCWA